MTLSVETIQQYIASPYSSTQPMPVYVADFLVWLSWRDADEDRIAAGERIRRLVDAPTENVEAEIARYTIERARDV